MLYHKIVLAGGNGYLGNVLAAHYKSLAQEVVILSRKPKVADGNIRTIVWDGETPGSWVKELEGADLLVNLCGKNVNCRYTAKNKKEIYDSRLLPTALLGKVIAGLAHPPQLWINASSATIYRHAEDRPQDEINGETGEGFSVDVCQKWEGAFFSRPTPETRKVALRISMVLGKDDSVFPRLLNLVKFGLGGRQGNGRQYMAWIHEHDVARITEWLLQHPEMDGAVNCTAPIPVTNSELMETVRQTYGTRLGLPSPAWLLKIGAIIIGTETELILKSRWVLPKRLVDAGYQFKFSSINEAVAACLK